MKVSDFYLHLYTYFCSCLVLGAVVLKHLRWIAFVDNEDFSCKSCRGRTKFVLYFMMYDVPIYMSKKSLLCYSVTVKKIIYSRTVRGY